MTRADDKRLDDMREACELVAHLTARGKEEFENDRAILPALERALEILGEAANNATAETKTAYPAIPWTDIVRLRVRLAHHYHRTVPERLWVIATDDVPRVAWALEP